MPPKQIPKKWSIPLELDWRSFDPESMPNRIVRNGLFHLWAKFPTVVRDIEYRLGKAQREMYEATYRGKPALVDKVTGQVYIKGVCQSGDQRIC